MLLRVYNGDNEVNDVARRAELPGIALGAENREQVFVRVSESFAVFVGKSVDLLQKQVQRLGVAV